MNTKEKLIKVIREVPISMTYEEYVEALADKFCTYVVELMCGYLEENKTLGGTIKRLMKENGYTQKQLAMRSGCTESAISRYVRNERTPSIRIMKNLAIALGVTVGELMKRR